MPDSVLESEVDSVTAQELDALMKEFPDWADEFPDIQQQLQFARYFKRFSNSQCHFCVSRTQVTNLISDHCTQTESLKTTLLSAVVE